MDTNKPRTISYEQFLLLDVDSPSTKTIKTSKIDEIIKVFLIAFLNYSIIVAGSFSN